MILSELIPFLESLGVSPKKGLSQNFLIDPNIVKKIVRTAEVKAGEVVLEIGPGPGALTQELLQTGAKVFAIEKDPVFAKALSRLQTPDNRLVVFCADVLEFPLKEIPAQKVVANLPYHITTPILEALFSLSFSSLTLMVQKEFADRILAKPGNKDFSSMTVFSQFHSIAKASFSVSRQCFYPKPSIDSSVMRLDWHPKPLSSPESFFKVVRKAFQQRRKMLSSSLADLYEPAKIRQGLEKIGQRQDARPEMLGLLEWLALFQQLAY